MLSFYNIQLSRFLLFTFIVMIRVGLLSACRWSGALVIIYQMGQRNYASHFLIETLVQSKGQTYCGSTLQISYCNLEYVRFYLFVYVHMC